MPARIENIIIKCPLCLMPHNYRLKVYLRMLNIKVPKFRDSEKVQVKISLQCPGLKESFDTRIPIVFSRNERIERVEPKGFNLNITKIG